MSVAAECVVSASRITACSAWVAAELLAGLIVARKWVVLVAQILPSG